MMSFFLQLTLRNSLLFWYGLVCFFGGVICLILTQTTTQQVNNINAFIKPMKFFFSVWSFCWTMAWLMVELRDDNITNSFSLMVVIVMSFELIVITWQAANGRLSHFNVTNSLYSTLFTLMGIAISILTLWTLFIGFQFFKLNNDKLPIGYLWGIRLGIILFVIFSFEGGIMGSKLQHTVGGLDSTEGIPILNWSKKFGDLRIAHFLGIHSLQLLPLMGFYLFKEKYSIICFSTFYACLVSYTLLTALKGMKLI